MKKGVRRESGKRKKSKSAADAVMHICPEKFVGDSEVLKRKLSVRYRREKLDEAVSTYQRKNAALYAIIAVFAAFTFIVSAAYTFITAENMSYIKRPSAGEGELYVPVNIEAKKGDMSIDGNATIVVKEQEMTDEEIENMIVEFAAELPDKVAPESQGVRKVGKGFSLPEKDSRTGISIQWESSDSVLINPDGTYDVLALDGDSETVTLTAQLTYNDIQKEVSFDVLLVKDSELYGESVKGKIKELVQNLSDSEDGNIVSLPKSLGEDISLRWKKSGSGAKVSILVFALAAVMIVYIFRFRGAEKEVKKYRSGITGYFPPFIDKFVLLLNSGLTVMTAMEKMADDCERQSAYDRKNLLAAEVSEIGRRVKNLNSSIVKEWREFAGRTSISEIMRFSTIIEENLNKGSALADKLESESNLLREKEKKSVQERIRMIDSKLTMPMILMLFSLVLVTVAPAMMQM